MPRSEPCTWRGFPATRIIGDALEAVICHVGASLVCLRHPGSPLNPLWQPGWTACEPDRAGPEHGEPAERALLAVIAGSNLCLDRFGAAWPGEAKPLHGEAGVSRWTPIAGKARWTCTLPLARLHVERRLALDGTTAVLSTTVRHDDAAPRAVEWCEHITLGDPFLDGAELSAGIDGAWNAPWPGSYRSGAQPLAAIDPATALRMPRTDAAACGDVVAARVAAGWWQAVAHAHRLRVTWRREDFPWLAIWTEHRSRGAAPWRGRERARGMELSTKPFPEGAPPPSRMDAFEGAPTTCRVPPGPAGRTHEVRLEWTRLG